MKKIKLACMIDDNRMFLLMAQKMLEKADFCHDLLVYKNGKEALDNIKTMKEEDLPDIIFLDLNMPVLDGWQFLDEYIKFNYQKKIYIYILTSSIDPEDIKKAKTYQEVHEFLQKPLSVPKLQEILAEFENR